MAISGLKTKTTRAPDFTIDRCREIIEEVGEQLLQAIGFGVDGENVSRQWIAEQA